MTARQHPPTAVSTTAAPAAVGPYSQAVDTGTTVHVSGQLPIDPATGAMVEPDIRTQTARCLANLLAVLDETGLGPEQVVQVTVLLADMADFSAMNQVYAQSFRPPHPARMAFQAARLPLDALVEISAVATRA